jgi:hypothetical protein
MVSMICSIKWMFQISWVFEYTVSPAWFRFKGYPALPAVTPDSTHGTVVCQPGNHAPSLQVWQNAKKCSARFGSHAIRDSRLQPVLAGKIAAWSCSEAVPDGLMALPADFNVTF